MDKELKKVIDAKNKFSKKKGESWVVRGFVVAFVTVVTIFWAGFMVGFILKISDWIRAF